MSLINEMLKDIKKRPHSDVLSGLRADISMEFKKNKKYYLIISVLSVIVLVSSLFLILKKDTFSVPSIKNSAVVNTATSVPSHHAPIEIHSTPILLTGIALQVQQNLTYLRLLLSQNAFYQLSNDVKKNELTIIFENMRLLAALPKINYAGSGIEDIQAFSDEYGNLKLILRLSSNVEISRLDLNEEGKSPELQLDILSKNDNDTMQSSTHTIPTIPITIKKPVAESNAEKDYQIALRYSANGQNSDAIQLLKNLLLKFPTHVKAREYLVTLLFQQGNKFEADQFVKAGLKEQPNALSLIKLQARIFVDEGKLNQAVSLLEKTAPELSIDPDYHAFIAAIYQRQGRVDLAENIYKQLVTLQPENPNWWVGLGVALDTLGNQAQALEAYSNADNIGGLKPELKAYLATRLHTA
jgi:tetratricopeptide (TPR) repeat protein